MNIASASHSEITTISKQLAYISYFVARCRVLTVASESIQMRSGIDADAQRRWGEPPNNRVGSGKRSRRRRNRPAFALIDFCLVVD